jgi:hypothetical protein
MVIPIPMVPVPIPDGSHPKSYLLIALHCNGNLIYVLPENELRGLSPNFHFHVSVSHFIYSQDRSTYFPAAGKADRMSEYIKCSQTHECGNCMGLRQCNSISGNICFEFSL